jgi:phosphate transport system substrate-binding protein
MNSLLLNRLNPKRTAWSALLVLLVLMLASCSDSEDAFDPKSPRLTGTIEIDGSSTVFPITEAVAEDFHKVNSDVQVNVGVSGTGGGFKRFITGETDISDASRPIKDEEAATAVENGIEYIEIKIALDGISVVVNPNNKFIDCLTVTQLKDIWEPESKIERWSDLNPDWGDKKIRLYGPGTDSGTFDYFTEEIVGEAQRSRADYTASEDDNVLVQGIAGDRNSLGYFGYAYYAENSRSLKLVDIDAGDGCVTPTETTIQDGTFKPLSRPLYIYVNTRSLQRPAVMAFLEYYLEHGAELSTEVGYISLPSAVYDESLTVVHQADDSPTDS